MTGARLAVCLLLTLPVWAAGRVELKIQLGHADSITSVAFSPEGRWVLTSGDVTARLWDRNTSREFRRFVHPKKVSSADISPDGKRVLTASGDELARIWDVASGREILRIDPKAGEVSSVAFSPDGRRVATATFTRGAIVWDAATGRELFRVEQYCAGVKSVTFSRDGRTILTACAEFASLWEADTGKAMRQIEVNAEPPALRTATLSTDGRMIAAASRQSLKLLNAATGALIRTINADSYGADFSPDSTLVLAGTRDGAKLYEVASGREVRSFAVRTDFAKQVGAVKFSRDGREALGGSYYPAAALWEIATGRTVRRFEGEQVMIDAAFSPDGRSLLLVECQPYVLQWDLAAGRELRRLTSANQGLCYASFGGGGRVIVTGGAPRVPGEEGVEIWDAVTGKLSGRIGGTAEIEALVASNDGRFVFVSTELGDQRHHVALRDRVSGRELWAFDNEIRVQALALSADGKLALAGSNDRSARLLDVATGKELRRVTADNPIFTVEFAPDGKTFLTVGARSEDRATTTLWEVAPGRLLRRFVAEAEGRRAAFSPDSRYVITNHGSAAQLYDAVSGREVQRFEGHTGDIMSARFSPDGRRLVTASLDGTCRIWDVASGKTLATLVSFREGGWAVVDPEGRYDAADPDNAPGLYWKLDDEVIELRQLKERFYAPGLLARTLGFNKEPLPAVAGLDRLQLSPAVEIVAPKAGQVSAVARVTNRGGGIGRVMVKVNGRTVPLAMRGGAIDPNAGSTDLRLDFSEAELASNGKNQIEVIAFDRDNLVSRGYTAIWEREPEAQIAPPALYAIVAGVSRFENPVLNLTFPAKDATDMSQAISVGGARLFGVERVHIRTFATGSAEEPTKENIRRAFEEVATRAGPDDVLLVYFAGHGVAGKSERDSYYFLTREARSLEPGSDVTLRAQTTISSAELLDWLRRKGMPLRQVLVLDTCAAGAATAELLKLAEPRDLSADQRRAIELLKGNTGSHILMGAASDKVSYEASRYGQGLLTYALLLAMRGEGLDEGGRLDVRKWFDTAERRVPEFARGIGGIQTPVVSSPSGQTFPIGLIRREDWDKIPLARLKAQLLRATCLDEDDGDRLQLAPALRAELRAASIPATRGSAREEPPLVYLDQVAGDVADALTPQVRYWMESNRVRVRIRLLGGEQRIERTVEIPSTTPSRETEELAKRIRAEIIALLPPTK